MNKRHLRDIHTFGIKLLIIHLEKVKTFIRRSNKTQISCKNNPASLAIFILVNDLKLIQNKDVNIERKYRF